VPDETAALDLTGVAGVLTERFLVFFAIHLS
jgi:hypothetical protein